MTDASPLTRRTLVSIGSASALGAGVLLLTACTPAGADPGSGGDSTLTVPLSSIPVGGAMSAQLGSEPVVVSQPTAGKVVAFSAVCTHLGCTVAPSGNEFDCPCHGSRYDGTTGDVIRGPAQEPLAKLTATVSGDTVKVSK
ncbi:ubiquinol-cytochrome c reductase iron-sulfur subunit [Leifsonia sp. NPDC058248]|uniref:QcrA and Rieske domain-containing protein n=1 Tax=Leifsonia sp. NPDC058248 TaxID=3346402 RepID=UPI0036DAFF2B